MSIRVIVVLAGCIALGSAMLAAPGQDRQEAPAPGTERPGQLTKGRVWVENREPHEAVPVIASRPMPVVVLSSMHQWEYQIVTVGTGTSSTDLLKTLRSMGVDGWETAGVQVPSGASTFVVMKRPRPDVR
jgi:hypothetical protein